MVRPASSPAVGADAVSVDAVGADAVSAAAVSAAAAGSPDVVGREPATRTRAQRTSDSRTRILDAAVSALVEGGYSAATTLTIQARAGVSRGRLLHHFPSRDLLLVAAAQHLAVKRVRDTEDRLAELLDGSPSADLW